MVFNMGMTDAELIDLYGGPTKLARLLGWTQSGAAQRIHNWRKRGIPSSVKVAYQDLLLHPPKTKPQSPKQKGAAHV